MSETSVTHEMLHKRILEYMATQNHMVSRLKINASIPLLLLSTCTFTTAYFQRLFPSQNLMDPVVRKKSRWDEVELVFNFYQTWMVSCSEGKGII